MYFDLTYSSKGEEFLQFQSFANDILVCVKLYWIFCFNTSELHLAYKDAIVIHMVGMSSTDCPTSMKRFHSSKRCNCCFSEETTYPCSLTPNGGLEKRFP